MLNKSSKLLVPQLVNDNRFMKYTRHLKNRQGNAGFFILVLIAVVIAVVFFSSGKIGGPQGASGDLGASDSFKKFLTDKVVRAVSKPRLPVGGMTRDSISGRTKVLQLTSEADRAYIIDVKVKRPATGITKTFSYKSEPGKTEEIGWAEGWGFVDGDEVVLSHPEFADFKTFIGKNRINDELTEEQKDLSLEITWKAVPDIIGYRVRIGSQPGSYDYTSPVINGTSFYVASAKLRPGVYWYSIVSVNEAGNESLPTEPKEFTVR